VGTAISMVDQHEGTAAAGASGMADREHVVAPHTMKDRKAIEATRVQHHRFVAEQGLPSRGRK